MVGALVLVVYFGWSAGGSSDARVDLASTSAAPAPERPQTLIINTDRRGPHHVMRAILTGPNGRPQGVSFIVDTGASDVVLPSSLIARLGFEANDLPGLQLQTANGVVSARRGVLKALEIGAGDNREVIERVSVLFISDVATGGTALMGMSVLGRYNMTIEDDEDRIVLARRR